MLKTLGLLLFVATTPAMAADPYDDLGKAIDNLGSVIQQLQEFNSRIEETTKKVRELNSNIERTQQPSPSQACGPVDTVLKMFEEKYQETPRYRGVTEAGALMIITESDKGTWTIFLSNGSEICAMVGGEDLVKSMPQKTGLGA
jgi:hypothetical protein